MQELKSWLLLAVLVAIAGCVAAPSPPSGAAAPGSARADSSTRVPGRGHGEAHRLPQLRLDSGSVDTGVTDARGHAPKDASARAPSTSADTANVEGFVLGDGDEIKFTMFGQPDMATETLVSAQGRVSLPLIDSVDVGGLTPSQAEARITRAYRDGGYFTDPQVNVTVAQYRSRQISVLGEVNKPGRYPLETRTTVLDALAQAEGAKATGARVITIIRKTAAGSRYEHVDTDGLVNGGQPVTLNAGDIVYVPEAKRFYIYGEVQKPDAYPIRPGMRVMQAIAVGGGLTPRGSNSRIEIRRVSPEGEQRVSAKLSDTVRAGDVIFVKERFF